MTRHVLFAGTTAAIALAALLVAGAAAGQDGASPAARQPAGPSPAELRARAGRAPLTALRSAADVRQFIDLASAAPVTQREEVRAIIGRSRENAEVTKALIAEFERAQPVDFSRALVILSLIGEQRNPTGTGYLAKFLQRPLPRDGQPTAESGLSPEAEALERLQVKAANALPYARTAEASRATLQVVRGHPLKAVRIEAASSFLWNAGNSAEARRALAAVLRPDEQAVLDRPVRDQNTTAPQFNRQLAAYLDRHPELRAPAPQPSTTGPSRAAEDAAGPTPPSERTR